MTLQNTYCVPAIYHKITNRFSPLAITVPGSKSITNRALLLATLADGLSTLQGVLFSDDSRHFLQCIRDLGFETDVWEEEKRISIKGLGGKIPLQSARQYVGSAGTAARFLTAFLGVSRGTYHMDASDQMRRRPMAPLLNSLKELGCEILYEGEPGHFPFTLKGQGFCQDKITVNIDSSSQFLSALMIASCLSTQDFTVAFEGSHGMAYIEMTRKMMEQFSVITEPLYFCEGNSSGHDCNDCVNRTNPYAFRIKAGQHYKARDYSIEPDASAACYFYAMCPLLEIPVLVNGVHFGSLQGDVEFLHILEQMGCSATDTSEGILLKPPTDGHFHGVTVNMSACSDQAITLAAIAPFADSPTTITDIGHIRYQESDRLAAITTELGRMGIVCQTTDTSITIYPGAPSPCTVHTYEDHRMAMGFSLIGLRAEGIVIDNPSCCRKTFEDYFEVLEAAISRLTS